MSNRVTDDQAVHMMTWARHYGDIESWKRIGKSGAKWLVKFTFKGTLSSEASGPIKQEDFQTWADFMLGPRQQDLVPNEMVLTNREVMLLCYGLAIGGERKLSRHLYREAWDRGVKDPAEAVAQEIASREVVGK